MSDTIDQAEVLGYWRRKGEPPYPVSNSHDVEVLTSAEFAEEYGGDPKGVWGWEWTPIPAADDIDSSLGLCDSIREIRALCDALQISVAIHRHLGIPVSPWMESVLWRRDEFNSHDAADLLHYLDTMRDLYGREAAEMALRQYCTV